MRLNAAYITKEHTQDLVKFQSLLKDCCWLFGIDNEVATAPSRQHKPLFARVMFCYVAQHPYFKKQLNANHSQTLISRFINRHRSRASAMKQTAISLYLYDRKFREVVDGTEYKIYFETIKKQKI